MARSGSRDGIVNSNMTFEWGAKRDGSTFTESRDDGESGGVAVHAVNVACLFEADSLENGRDANVAYWEMRRFAVRVLKFTLYTYWMGLVVTRI